jgi:hypothetical protein
LDISSGDVLTDRTEIVGHFLPRCSDSGSSHVLEQVTTVAFSRSSSTNVVAK